MVSVSRDPHASTIFDSDHSEAENRWITLGVSRNGKLLVVCHTFKYLDEEILSFVQGIAKKRKTDVSSIVNQILRSDMHLAEVIK